ncbi:MAG: DUF1059 domain-containing protein [candidate division WWE3 bacterium]|nr:DUF1059 domain-containing protein [candidate division WWE3 bacterium]
MKTMTCRDMGGPCDTKISGETPDEMMKIGEEHLRKMKDPAHMKLVADMEKMSTDSVEMKKWNDEFVAKFNALPHM